MVKLRNVGSVDQIIRLLLGAALIACVFIGPQTPFGWIGIVAIITALFRFCPAYWLLGIKTCAVPEDR